MRKLLASLKGPGDLKNFSYEDLSDLSKELRHEIIEVVAKNGGHLASNLGVIELTLALLRQFSPPHDKIVWDVGHQTYAYKILTGRRDNFESLRLFQGLSGFPKTCESDYDCFNTGHSSTSVSAALGLSRGYKLQGEDRRVLAVIGDGALTGGMAFEALNDAGQSDANLIIILNDNEMSIGKNVGGMARHLGKIRLSRRYLNFKHVTGKLLSKTRPGRYLKKILDVFKHLFRYVLASDKVIFEDLGIKYYGPVDGHDIKELEMYLEAVKKIEGPVLLHVLTKKGKGFDLAEEKPDFFHGVSPFEIRGEDSAEKLKDLNDGPQSFSQAFSAKITAMAEEDDRIVAISAAMASGTGLDKFEEKYPSRFYDVGIAEQHAMTLAAGLSASGLKPVIALYSTFLQRAYDQLLHDVALQGLNLVLCVDRAGIVGEDGETHQGIYDIPLLLSIPGLRVLSPRNFSDLAHMLDFAFKDNCGPVAIRYPRGKEGELSRRPSLNPNTDEAIFLDKEKCLNIKAQVLRVGKDVSIFAEGIMCENALKAAELLSRDKIDAEVLDLRSLKPLDEETVLESGLKTGLVLILENGLASGGIGDRISDLFSGSKKRVGIIKAGVGDHPLQQGSIDELQRSEGMDYESVAERIKRALNRGINS